MFKSRSIFSLFVICMFIALLFPLINIFFIYPSFTGLLIEDAEDDALRLGTHLASTFFRDDRPLPAREIQEHANSFLHNLGLIKMKIFSPSGEIVYSTEASEIGHINDKEYFHKVVAAGRPFTKIVHKDSRSLEDQTVSVDVVETYVPVMSDGRFTGAFEIYYDVTDKNRSLNNVAIKYSIIPFIVMCGFLLVIAAVLYKLDRSIAERNSAEEALKSAHKELEKKVRERTRELTGSNEELKRMMFITAHDLQEPLRKIITLGDIVKLRQSCPVDGKGNDYVSRIQKASARMRALIDDMHAYAQIITNTRSLVSVDLESLTREIVLRHKPELDRAGAHVDIVNLPRLEADPLQMRHLMYNLIENAIKFRNPDTAAEVRIYTEYNTAGHSGSEHGALNEMQCEIHVEDNGIGFDDKYADRIFDVFQRLHGEDEYEGTGIGLSICRKVAEQHGGHITVKSRPGEGSSFIITLPVKPVGEDTNVCPE